MVSGCPVRAQLSVGACTASEAIATAICRLRAAGNDALQSHRVRLHIVHFMLYTTWHYHIAHTYPIYDSIVLMLAGTILRRYW
jgi:hypothetical protein